MVPLRFAFSRVGRRGQLHEPHFLQRSILRAWPGSTSDWYGEMARRGDSKKNMTCALTRIRINALKLYKWLEEWKIAFRVCFWHFYNQLAVWPSPKFTANQRLFVPQRHFNGSITVDDIIFFRKNFNESIQMSSDLQTLSGDLDWRSSRAISSKKITATFNLLAENEIKTREEFWSEVENEKKISNIQSALTLQASSETMKNIELKISRL